VLALVLCSVVRSDTEDYRKITWRNVGDKAPTFQARDDQGKLWRSQDHVGKKVIVVVFYIGDYFPDCTRQLCGYRDRLGQLKAQGVEVIGISGDLPENHPRYVNAFGLNFPLLSDPEGKVATEFGMPLSSGGLTKGKDADGREIKVKRGSTLARWTWVIGLDGRVIHKDMNADPKEDSKRVLELLRRLAAERQP
jgi:peroxiredoxin Q/BCP